MKVLLPIIIFINLVWFFSCNKIPGDNGGEILREDNSIFIVDQTGKRWDVTHAENKYQMAAGGFQFGLGPNAIKPITNPSFSSQGEPRFPDPSVTDLVIGTRINGDARAYPLSAMSLHEVVVEQFDSTHVSVTY